ITVEEVIEIGSYNHYQEITQKERSSLVVSVMERLELMDFRHRLFPTLSGGEKKRVLLAKCLVQLQLGQKNVTSQYLLLDEPTAALDVAQQYRFMELATALAKERGIGVLAILHDLNLAARFADQIILLNDSEVVAAGAVKEVLTKEMIATVFSVESFIQPHPHFNIPLITTYGNYNRIESSASYA
ncbi:MAG: ATP-binding cassette domain-containing protein, partial [Bacteroidota bacterium]